nr:citrate lyase holo-[acyl-carrier protein] synthase [Clostridium rhizosphaerae]
MDILDAREERVRYQEHLLIEYKCTIISYKLNIPGNRKYNLLIKQIFDEGLSIFNKKLDELSINKISEKIIYKDSGPEYFAVFNESEHKIKKLTTDIEEKHALGRLFDFDVISKEGKQISRKELGIASRRCFLCGNNAFECGRSRRHKISDLTDRIEKMALDYFTKQKSMD